MDIILLMIDGLEVRVPPGTTLYHAAQQIGVKIPTICFHEFCTSNALCRICVVEVEGMRTLQPACVVQAAEGMQVHTRSERVCTARRTILEMMAASLDLSQAADIQELMLEYGAAADHFPEAETRQAVLLDDNSQYIRDYTRCILCWRCVQVCGADAQYTYAINFEKRGFHTQISTFYQIPLPESSCVFCGQCIGVCPTNALKTKRQWLLEAEYSPDEIMGLTRAERKSKTRSKEVRWAKR